MRIFVENLEFVGAHGVYEEERVEGRRFKVDLEVEVSDAESSVTDDLGDTLDYRELAGIVVEVAQGPSRALIEKLAGKILTIVFARCPQVKWARVRIKKAATGVPGNPEYVGVELERTR